MYIYKYGSHAGPPTTSLNSDPCSIRVSSVAQGSLASLLSGTSVRSVAKEQERASVPHFLDKPRVRPLPTELQIGSLVPARSLVSVLAIFYHRCRSWRSSIIAVSPASHSLATDQWPLTTGLEPLPAALASFSTRRLGQGRFNLKRQ